MIQKKHFCLWIFQESYWKLFLKWFLLNFKSNRKCFRQPLVKPCLLADVPPHHHHHMTSWLVSTIYVAYIVYITLTPTCIHKYVMHICTYTHVLLASKYIHQGVKELIMSEYYSYENLQFNLSTLVLFLNTNLLFKILHKYQFDVLHSIGYKLCLDLIFY